ncbi:MAG: putative universal stress protein [Puniceicoccaceae bacterium 5H]|nr:MAG: putative universal stress protein [Puniceicoccaceae bacterium 5H]
MNQLESELDLGAMLQQGQSPLPVVHERVTAMQPGETIVLHVPFEPVPLYEQLRVWGADYTVVPEAGGFCITVEKLDTPAVNVPLFLDLRRLPPPEPMQRTLETYAGLPVGGSMVVHVPHRPGPLLAQLAARGIPWEEEPQPDSSYHIYLLKEAE